jgi:uncharacterized membrane protein YeaQ/YmgE (transglycosylase-associated protein family)
MSVIELLILLAIASLCGGIGQSLVGYSAGGCLVSLFVGVIGAYLGLWVARSFDLPVLFALELGGVAYPIIWSVIGAALFSAILGLVQRAIAGR